MNIRSLAFLCMTLVLASLAQARLGDEVEEATPDDQGVRRLPGGNSGRYSDWASRCCGQNNNEDCLCPIRKWYPDFAADKWDAKCAEN